MAKYYENIVIGKPICDIIGLISNGTVNDYNEEIEKTYITDNRSIPNILKDLEIVKSVSEVRRNKPELFKESLTDHADCFWIKWGKRKFYVIVGPMDSDILNKEKRSDTWIVPEQAFIGSNTIISGR